MIGNRDIVLDRTKLENFAFQMNHCGLQACSPGYSYGFEMRPYHLVHFVLDGSGTLKTDRDAYAIQHGQAFYIPAGTCGFYRASLDRPWKYCWIGFYTNTRSPFLKQLFGRSQVIDLKMPLGELEQLILSIISVTDPRFCDAGLYRESDYPGAQFFNVTDLSKSMEVNSRMMHLFSRLLETQADGRPLSFQGLDPASDAKAYIDTCYNEPIKVQDIADALHIHPNYLSAVFKKAYGQSPSRYLRSLRMAQASMLLYLTDYPVSAVARAVGYTNPFQFTAAFKAFYHVPPTLYRKQERKNDHKNTAKY